MAYIAYKPGISNELVAEAEAGDEGAGENDESAEIGAASGLPAGRIKTIRKWALILGIIALVVGGLLSYSEDLLLPLQSVISTLLPASLTAEGQVRSVVLANGKVMAFMENNSDSKMHVSYFQIDNAGLMFKQMRSDCNLANSTSQTSQANRTGDIGNIGNIREVYRVILDVNDTNRSLTAWVEWPSQRLICVAEKGNWTIPCRTHAYSKCHNNDFYWFNSCDELEEIKMSCFGICRNNTCKPNCVLEGKAAGPADNLACCDGLETLANSTVNSSNSECVPPVNDSFLCTKCGNGLCQPPENECNCPADCNLTCNDTDGIDYTAQGSVTRLGVKKWDKCINTKGLIEYYCEHKAIRNQTYMCPINHSCDFGKCVYSEIPCTEEGGIAPLDTFSKCCKGLTASGRVSDGYGGCRDSPATFACIKCGDGECGLGETDCNCPEDCA